MRLQAAHMGYLTALILYFGLSMPHQGFGITMAILSPWSPEGKIITISTCTAYKQNDKWGYSAKLLNKI